MDTKTKTLGLLYLQPKDVGASIETPKQARVVRHRTNWLRVE